MRNLCSTFEIDSFVSVFKSLADCFHSILIINASINILLSTSIHSVKKKNRHNEKPKEFRQTIDKTEDVQKSQTEKRTKHNHKHFKHFSSFIFYMVQQSVCVGSIWIVSVWVCAVQRRDRKNERDRMTALNNHYK